MIGLSIIVNLAFWSNVITCQYMYDVMMVGFNAPLTVGILAPSCRCDRDAYTYVRYWHLHCINVTCE